MTEILKETANIIRGLSADAVQRAESGHPGMPIGCAEIGAVLYGKVMKHDPQKPDWPDRDRFVLSAGHGSMLLYSLLHLSGYDLSLDELKKFRQIGHKTPGHPEYNHTEGVETTTGPLAQGFANAVGMALSERMLAARYNSEDFDIVDHYTYTILGDGCMMEGLTSEAASMAGHLGLDKLVAVYDDNRITIAGNTDLTFSESVSDRFKAFDWQVIDDIDGHDPDQLIEAVKRAKEDREHPSLIIASTNIAFGSPTMQDSHASHGAPLGEEEIRGLKRNINLPEDEKFYVSDRVIDYFKKRSQKLKRIRKNWENNFSQWKDENPELNKEWEKAYSLAVPDDIEDLIELNIEPPSATRNASGDILNILADKLKYLIGGSADLAPSTKTYLNKSDDIQKDSYNERNLRFGVREHAMGSIVNGISLHGGLRPFCSTFLVFADYMRPPIRLAAMMNQPVIYVFTHDSVFLGEDGPTHQPIEHVESLRIIPNLKVIRPADEEETKEAWIEAVKRTSGPTALIFTRQEVNHIEKVCGTAGFKRGGYIVKKEEGDSLDVVFMASGSEVNTAFKTAELLSKKKIGTRIVSVPDREEFIKNNDSYIKQVLGPEDKLRVAVEAGVGQGWYQLLGDNSILVTIDDRFGISGPTDELDEIFGFAPEDIALSIIEKLSF